MTRLIDADALKADIDKLRLFKPWIREEIKTHIDNAPTIITEEYIIALKNAAAVNEAIKEIRKDESAI